MTNPTQPTGNVVRTLCKSCLIVAVTLKERFIDVVSLLNVVKIKA